MNPRIYMFHRVSLNKENYINRIYFQRGMVHTINSIFDVIDDNLGKGYLFGSVEETLTNDKYFHLSFDDGFVEHLKVAYIINGKYNPGYDSISFAINIGNSIMHNYTGMDLIYEILINNKLKELEEFLKTKLIENNIDQIKQYIAKLSPKELILLSQNFKDLHKSLKNTFLSKDEVRELSELFTISSHGITHRFLNYHHTDSANEILESKMILEEICKKEVKIFCYPEGKNNWQIQKFCMKAGYEFVLSIRHEEINRFCVGRKI